LDTPSYIHINCYLKSESNFCFSALNCECSVNSWRFKNIQMQNKAALQNYRDQNTNFCTCESNSSNFHPSHDYVCK